MTLPMPVPKWLPDPQEYAIEQQRASHDQALAHFGEYAVFVLMWKLADHEKGLVGRCPTCYLNRGDIAETYGQAAQEKCPDCFGTTFEGGYKARIVRLSLWDANEEDIRENKRGQIEISTASIQSTSDFRLRTGDFIFRGDGTRWRMQNVSTNHLRTGFMMPTKDRTPVGYNFGQVMREDPSSVAYEIAPSPQDLRDIDLINQRYPADFSDIEDIRGSLTHTEEVDDSDSGDSP